MKIKVRVWHKKLNEYVKPSRYLVIDEFGELFNDECVIEQFTGLKDKNGKDIYEGDLLRWEFFVKPVKVYFDDKLAQFNSVGTAHGWRDYEIIGNIHENPELME